MKGFNNGSAWLFNLEFLIQTTHSMRHSMRSRAKRRWNVVLSTFIVQKGRDTKEPFTTCESLDTTLMLPLGAPPSGTPSAPM